MNGQSRTLTYRHRVSQACFALSSLALVQLACNDPTKPDFSPIDVEGEEICEASAGLAAHHPRAAAVPAGAAPRG